MKKFSKFLNNIILGLFSAWGALFVLKIIGFSLGIDLGIFLRVIMGFLSLGLIVNFRKIKEILSSKDFRKNFFLLTGFNIFVFALFLLFYPIFLFGSPFVFEDRIANFKVKEKIPLEVNKPIIQEFLSKSNKLGTIGVKILVEEKNREGEFEKELTGAVDKFVFRIKEKGARNYFYENIYEFNEYFQSGFYPFGFPLQENSKNKEYIFEIEKIEESSQRRFLVEINKDGNLNFYPRYVYNLASFKDNWKPIWENINRKSSQFLKLNNNQINVVFAFVLIEFLIFVFFKKTDPQFVKKINSYFRTGFLIGLFLIYVSSFDFEFIKKINFLLIGIKNLSDYKLYLIVLTTIAGILSFYFNKEKLEKEIEKEELQKKLAQQKRFEKFNQNFGIRGGYIIKSFFKWIYKEGRDFFIYVGIIIGVFSFLVYPALSKNDFYHDENWNIQVIDSLDKGEGFYLRNYILDKPTVKYTSGYLFNFFSFLTYRIFNKTLFGARFFGATVSLINLLLVFFIFRKFFPLYICFIIAIFCGTNIIFVYLSQFLRSYPLFLFFYLLVFWCLLKIDEILENQREFSFSFFFLLMIFLMMAIIEREIGKILFINLLFCFLISLKSFNYQEFFKFRKIWFSLLVLGVLVFVLDFFQIIHFRILLNQVSEFLSLKKILNPTLEYLDYLFERQFRDLVYLPFLFLGGFYLLWRGFLKKDSYSRRYKFLIIFFITPLFFNIFLLNRYGDFRYVYHIIPYANAILVSGIYFSLLFFSKKFRKNLIVLLFFVLTFYKPMVPFLKSDNYFGFKSISWWEGKEGAIYLHPRAVAPQYQKAFDFLNKNQQAGDVVLFAEKIRGIKVREEVDYYVFKYIWDFKEDLINLRNNQEISFSELIKKNQQRMWFIGAYIHMLPDFVNQYFLKNCQNISSDLGIFKFNYNNYYKNRFFWPNLFLCEFNNRFQ